MEKEYIYTFSTPSINVTAHYPNSTTVGASVTPIIFLGFSQLINEKEVLKVVTLCYGKNTKNGIPCRLVSPSDVKAIELLDYKKLLEKRVDGTWMAFTPVEPLNYGSNLSIVVGPNVPSAEGPNVNTATEIFNFSTVERFDVKCKKNLYFLYIDLFLACVPSLVTNMLTFEFTHPITQELSTAELDWLPQVTPQLPHGIWKMINTTTLAYVCNSHFAKSTKYTIRVSFSL